MSALRLRALLAFASLVLAIPGGAMVGTPLRCAVIFGNSAVDGLQQWEGYLARFVAAPALTRASWQPLIEELAMLPDADWSPRLEEVLNALRQAWYTKPIIKEGVHGLYKCDTTSGAGLVDMRHFLMLPDDALWTAMPRQTDESMNVNRAVLV